MVALRSVAIITAVTFGATGILTDPDIAGGLIKSEALRLLGVEIFVLLGVAGLVAIIICRRPARRQVYWLRECINAAGGLGMLAGGIGLAGGLDRPPYVLTIFGVTLVCGVTTLVLHFIWRTPRVG